MIRGTRDGQRLAICSRQSRLPVHYRADHGRYLPYRFSNVLHDRLPSMRLWRSRALIRDLVVLTTVLRAARHDNVTMESRSFHIVLDLD